MLKIKDNIDLKELEKFGFEYNQIGYKKDNLWILKEDRILRLPTKGQSVKQLIIRLSNNNKIDDTIYDLIKEGLIEKIEEK